MARPTDWHVVGLSHDPVPGDPADIRMLAAKYSEATSQFDLVATDLRAVESDGAVAGWTGDASDAFRQSLHPVPGRVVTASTTMHSAAEALRRWAASVEDAQAEADRALHQARVAHSDLIKAGAVASQAVDAQSRLDAARRSIQNAVADHRNAENVALRIMRAVRDDAEGLFPRRVSLAMQDLARLKNIDGGESMFGSSSDYRRFAADLARLSPNELNEFLTSMSVSQLAALSATIKANGSGALGGGAGNWDRQAIVSELYSRADSAQLARLTKAFKWVEPFDGDSLQPDGGLFDATTPEWMQIHQGNYGDCTWMSSLIAAARRDPSFAEDHVRPNANGTVSVLLYNDQRHPQWITVTGPLPADGASLMGAHGHVSPWNVSSPTWVSYYEKALAQSVDRAPMDLIGAEGTYRSFDWGNDAQGSMPTITGHESVDISTSVRGAFDTVSSDARAGKTSGSRRAARR